MGMDTLAVILGHNPDEYTFFANSEGLFASNWHAVKGSEIAS